jgi:hypothetical protein
MPDAAPETVKTFPWTMVERLAKEIFTANYFANTGYIQGLWGLNVPDGLYIQLIEFCQLYVRILDGRHVRDISLYFYCAKRRKCC